MERESERRHAPWIARYERVIALRAKDAAIADIARDVGISGTTVYRYLRLDGPPERKCYRARRTPLDPYKEHLLRRWDEGCHVATRLWREIRAMGYRVLVYQCLALPRAVAPAGRAAPEHLPRARHRG